MNTTKTDMTIATTIYNQLGGNRFTRMTGSKNFVGDTNSLTMKLSRNKIHAQWLKITLTVMDDYTMEFIKLNKKDGMPVTIRLVEGVYCDQLEEIFTEATGLYTRF